MDNITSEDISLFHNADLLLHKRSALEKVAGILSQSGKSLQAFIRDSYPLVHSSAGLLSPKVSRGENYRGLPYIVLDYPRHFAGDDTFSFRTVFLWGKYVVVSLHIGANWFQDLNASPFEAYFATDDEPWNHYLEEGFDFFAPQNFDVVKAHLIQAGFIRVARKIDFQALSGFPTAISNHFVDLAKLVDITRQA